MTEDEFAAYQSLAEETEDHRWAFGTGFTDPLEGIDTSVPDGTDPAALATYCLMLGDDALIYSHRLQQWMTRMPELEEETALANIALALLGRAHERPDAWPIGILGCPQCDLGFAQTVISPICWVTVRAACSSVSRANIRPMSPSWLGIMPPLVSHMAITSAPASAAALTHSSA